MTGVGTVGVAPVAAQDLVVDLRRRGDELEDVAEEARLLLARAGMSGVCATRIEHGATVGRRTAEALDEALAGITALDARPVHLVRGREVVRLHLDVRGVGDLDALLAALTDTGVLAQCLPPGDPAALNAALGGLPPVVVETLLAQVPGLLGRTDGVPFGLRDRANRRLLESEVGRLDERLRRLELGLEAELRRLGAPRPADLQTAPTLSRQLLAVGASGETWARLQRQHRRLVELSAVRGRLAGWQRDDALQLIHLDVAAGRAVVGRGDLDAASHVAVLVPGANTTLATLDRAYAGWLDRLHDVTQDRLDLEGGGRAATVLWVDYDAPQGLVPAAMGRGPATDAADRLPDFLAGVGAVDRQLVTTFGHSYGSVVLGRSLAERRGGVASDQVVALGSPGMGVQGSRELGLRDDQRLYASTLPGDPISAVGRWNPVTGDLGRLVHGPDPRRLADAETVALPVDDLEVEGRPWQRGADRHMQYLDAESVALGTFGDLAAGRHRYGHARGR